MKFVFLLLLILSILSAPTKADELIQPRRLVDAHTAGVLPRKYYDLEIRMYPNGYGDLEGCGVTGGFSIGITNRLNVGLSYGGDGVIGTNQIQPNPHPGGLIKYRIIEESYYLPAIALGYDHQGYGGINQKNNEYMYKSQGFFAALSKNYLLFSYIQFGLHGSVTYSLEQLTPKNNWPNCYCGIDVGFNEELGVAFEYDFALNSNINRFGEPVHNPLMGYLNIGVRWAFQQSFFLEFDVKDILQNKRIPFKPFDRVGWRRELKIGYLANF